MWPHITELERQVAIVGAGPAGSSLAIRLASAGFRVTLIERERFPRQKLCGEFISPECLPHFAELGVLGDMYGAGARRVTETRFFAMNGRSVSVPSGWFGSGDHALSLSRAEMDMHLLERARNLGVEIREGVAVSGVDPIKSERNEISSIKIKDRTGSTGSVSVSADVFVDATGRAAVLTGLAEKALGTSNRKISRPEIVAFKTHVRSSAIFPSRCEVYSFPGGYGGLSQVEHGLANHCFMIRAETARRLGGDADRIVRELVFQNGRAKEMLEKAEPATKWLSVAVAGFGRNRHVSIPNLLPVGDAAAFIDPFTGSGILMALESAELLAGCISECSLSDQPISSAYRSRHAARFRRRLAVCYALRGAAFRPLLAGGLVNILSASQAFGRYLARSTRAAEITKNW